MNLRLRHSILVSAPVLLGICGAAILLLLLRPSSTLAQQVNASSLIWPISGSSQPDTSRIASPFGPRWQYSQQRYDYHPGIDIVAQMDTPVHVITDGIVTSVGWLSPSSGLTVIVSHTLAGYYSAYLHLNSTPVTVTQEVEQGEVIGYVGDSGSTNFIHLHFEIRVTRRGYPNNTRNPMGYLPHPDQNAPSIRITNLDNTPVYSPTISLAITTTRDELDVNQIRVILQDQATGQVLDEQLVDFNLRIHTGEDNLDQDGIRLEPSLFNSSTLEYNLSATFYQLVGLDAFTITAQVTDLSGQSSTVSAVGADTTPPGRVKNLSAHSQGNDHYTLAWSAPGDNGSYGTAGAYEVRYSDQPIDPTNWDNAIPLQHPPTPLPGGSTQTWDVQKNWISEPYFALRAVDVEGNSSLISNCASAHWTRYLPMIKR